MNINEAISNIGVVPVIKLNHPERDAAGLAKALCAGGVPVAEVTFRAAGAATAIKLMAEACPEMLVGAGTVLTTQQVDEALQTVGLSAAEKKPVQRYSMGMKQRLGVALPLLGGPDLLLLDEPINGLDPEGIREMRELLLRLNRERGITILLSSHILGELSKLATRYGIIQEGRLVEQITAGELAQRCADYLCLRTDQPEKAAALLEQTLRLTRWEMRPEREIRIYDPVDAKSVGRVLTQAGVAVKELSQHRQDLEGYFLERMGGEKHV